jgi:hypothetical protein
MKCSVGSTIPCQYHCVDVPEQSGTERSFEQLERTKVRNEKGQKSRLKHSLLISSGRRPERVVSLDVHPFIKRPSVSSQPAAHALAQ